jgi:hypothetical protein
VANPIKGEMPLKLSDGREFVLLSGTTALAEAEGVYGKPAHDIAADAQAGYMGAIRALFYGMLKRKQPSMTLDDAGDLLDQFFGEIEIAMEAAAKAAAAKQTEDRKSANPPKPRRGKTSGANGVK